MSVLSDRELKERLPNIIQPYDEERIGPASYDVALGNSFRICTNYSLFFVDLDDPPKGLTSARDLEDGQTITIHPGDFVLASTEERVEVPDDLVCRIEGRSSVARFGLTVHITAGFVDPGFHGRLTLECVNFLRVPIILRPGLVVAQLAFEQLSSPAEVPYCGRYQFDQKATESRYGQDIPRGHDPVVVTSWEPDLSPFKKPDVMRGYPLDKEEQTAVDRVVKDSEGR